jgi:hypothetical protein
MIVWQLDLQLSMQPVPITTKVVSLNPTSCEVYSYNITMYVIKFVSDLWQVGGFLQELRFTPPPTSRYSWNIVESGVKFQKHV